MSSTFKKALQTFAGIFVLGLASAAFPVLAQTTPPTSGTHSSVLPTGGGAGLLDASDTVFLLLDHQSGLFQTVKDIPVAELRSNVVMLAKLATLMKIPVITTASEPNGTNGPLMPEIHQFAPHAIYVPRKGEVNAWDNEDFVRTVRSTGKKTLVMAGVWTSVCVMFPALDAKLAVFLRQRTRCSPKCTAPGIVPKQPKSLVSMTRSRRTTLPLQRATEKLRKSREQRRTARSPAPPPVDFVFLGERIALAAKALTAKL